MPVTVILHVENEDPIVGEIEEVPNPSDTFVHVMNPRRLDGKDIHYLSVGVVEVIWPANRITFLEIMPADDEDIIGFVRE
jgi:hypothetical protein